MTHMKKKSNMGFTRYWKFNNLDSEKFKLNLI